MDDAQRRKLREELSNMVDFNFPPLKQMLSFEKGKLYKVIYPLWTVDDKIGLYQGKILMFIRNDEKNSIFLDGEEMRKFNRLADFGDHLEEIKFERNKKLV